jgi:inner membrane transporter RhtA
MTCVQLGAAVSVDLLDQSGAATIAWLRLAWAGVLMFLIARPRWSTLSRTTLGAGVALGLVTFGLTTLFMQAIARIPLGTASALEFLGPLTVAVLRGTGQRLVWPASAAVGVVLLTEPWHGGVNPAGIGFALGAAACWAAYILLTQRVGDSLGGLQGLGISMPVAAVAATLLLGPTALPNLTGQLVSVGLGLALLLPVIPFSLELLALRHLTTAAFGTLMCLEPAIAAVIGLALLDQVPPVAAIAGIALVVAAGVGAERGGARAGREPDATGPAKFVTSGR